MSSRSGPNSYRSGDAAREGHLEISVDASDLKRVVDILGRVEDGKVLRAGLTKRLRAELKPVAETVRSAALGLPSAGRGSKPALAPAIARGILPVVRMTKRVVVIGVRGKKTPTVRDFANAPMRFNRAAGWRHPVFGNPEHWVAQRGDPGWFDRPFEVAGPRIAAAVDSAVTDLGREIETRM